MHTLAGRRRRGAGAAAMQVQCGLPHLPAPLIMFTPSSDDVRRFFCEAYRKQRSSGP